MGYVLNNYKIDVNAYDQSSQSWKANLIVAAELIKGAANTRFLGMVQKLLLEILAI